MLHRIFGAGIFFLVSWLVLKIFTAFKSNEMPKEVSKDSHRNCLKISLRFFSNELPKEYSKEFLKEFSREFSKELPKEYSKELKDFSGLAP